MMKVESGIKSDALSPDESRAISIIRVMAMVAIVVCHILQGLNRPSAYIFNMGVQVFLFISGFLYGGKQIGNIAQWLKKRLVKIYLPYILFVSFVFVLYHLKGISFPLKNLAIYTVCGQWILGRVSGMGHLWFISCILMCYLATPFLQWLSSLLKQFLLPAILMGDVLWFWMFGERFLGMVVSLSIYAIAYAVSGQWAKRINLLMIMAIVSFGILSLYFKWEYILTPDEREYSTLFHALGGITLFLCLYKFLSAIVLPACQNVIGGVKRFYFYWTNTLLKSI